MPTARTNGGTASLDETAQNLAIAMKAAAMNAVPQRNVTPTRPWISPRTLDAIENRNGATQNGQWQLERNMNKFIKNPAKKDRRKWLKDMLDTGDWN